MVHTTLYYIVPHIVSVHYYEINAFLLQQSGLHSSELFSLSITDDVEQMPDSSQDQISDKLEHFGKCQQSEAEPKAEHSTEVRYVLHRLYTLYVHISLSSANTRELFHHSRKPRKTDVNPNTTSELLVKPLNIYSIALSRHTEFEILLDTVNTHTHPFNGTFSGTTRVGRYQKGKTNLDFTEAIDSEWQWHQLGHVQVCTSLQTDNHANTPTASKH